MTLSPTVPAAISFCGVIWRWSPELKAHRGPDGLCLVFEHEDTKWYAELWYHDPEGEGEEENLFLLLTTSQQPRYSDARDELERRLKIFLKSSYTLDR